MVETFSGPVIIAQPPFLCGTAEKIWEEGVKGSFMPEMRRGAERAGEEQYSPLVAD